MAAVVSVAAVGLMLTALVKKADPQYASLIGIICAAAVVLISVSSIKAIVDFSSGLAETAGVADGDFAVLVEALGIGLITQFTSDACCDAGEKTLAAGVELAGRVCIVAISLPLISRLLEIIKTVTGI